MDKIITSMINDLSILLILFFTFFFQFESRHLLTYQITKIIMVDTLVHCSNKPIDLSSLMPASPPSTKVNFIHMPIIDGD